MRDLPPVLQRQCPVVGHRVLHKVPLELLCRASRSESQDAVSAEVAVGEVSDVPNGVLQRGLPSEGLTSSKRHVADALHGAVDKLASVDVSALPGQRPVAPELVVSELSDVEVHLVFGIELHHPEAAAEAVDEAAFVGLTILPDFLA